jgi:hypothetical protein
MRDGRSSVLFYELRLSKGARSSSVPKNTDLQDDITYSLSLRWAHSLNDVLSKKVIKNWYSNLWSSEGTFGCCNTGRIEFVTFLSRLRFYCESKQPSADGCRNLQWAAAIYCDRQGRAIAQAVIRRLPTAAARVQIRVWSWGILWWTKVELGQVFSENFGFPCQSTFHLLLHNHLRYHPRLAQ